jgi:hypothetical protein
MTSPQRNTLIEVGVPAGAGPACDIAASIILLLCAARDPGYLPGGEEERTISQAREESEIPFVNEVGEWQAIALVFPRHLHHKPQMALDEFLESPVVPLLDTACQRLRPPVSGQTYDARRPDRR